MIFKSKKQLSLVFCVASILVLVLWIYNSHFKAQELPIQIGLYIMYALLILAVCAAIVLFSKGFNRAGYLSKKQVYVFALLLVCLVLGFFLDSGEIQSIYMKYGIDTPFESKCVGAVVFTSKLMLFTAVITAVMASLRAFIKQ